MTGDLSAILPAETLARTKPLTGAVPAGILRLQSTDVEPPDLAPHPCGSYSGPRWFCVVAAPRAEYRALLELSVARFRAYCPLLLRQVEPKRRGRPALEDVIEPLFPGYLFVRLDLFSDRWRRVFGVRGVDGLIMGSGERPEPLRRGAVDAIRTMGRAGDGAVDVRTDLQRRRSDARDRKLTALLMVEANRGRAREAVDAAMSELTFFPPSEAGATVRIKDGPFANLLACVTASADNRLEVLAEMFGRDVPLTLTRSEVEVVETTP